MSLLLSNQPLLPFYLKIIPLGAIASIIALTVVLELRRKSDRSLEINPWHRLRIIVGVQLTLYTFAGLLFVTLDEVAQTPFRWSQFFSYREYELTTSRGVVTTIAMTLAFAVNAMILVVIGRRSFVMYDLTLTCTILHYLISAVYNALSFPGLSGFWIALGVGFLSMLTISFFTAFYMELQPYKSSLGGIGGAKSDWESDPDAQQDNQESDAHIDAGELLDRLTALGRDTETLRGLRPTQLAFEPETLRAHRPAAPTLQLPQQTATLLRLQASTMSKLPLPHDLPEQLLGLPPPGSLRLAGPRDGRTSRPAGTMRPQRVPAPRLAPAPAGEPIHQ